MLIAYFDESGTVRDDHALTVAGAISTVTKWDRFRDRWNSVLASKGTDIFHMTDCAQGKKKFAGWTGDDRRSLVTDLVECMRLYVKRAFAVTIHLGDWRRVNEQFELEEHLISPYVYAARLCVMAVRHRLKGSGGSVEYVFEDGAKGKGELVRCLSDVYGVTPVFKPKALAPLQLADLIAWKNRKLLHDLVKKPFSMPEKDYLDSFSTIRVVPFDFKAVEEERLWAACRRFRIPQRNSASASPEIPSR